MKKILYSVLIATTMVACSENEMPQAGGEGESQAICSARDYDIEELLDDVLSRSTNSLKPGGAGFQFAWSQGDRISVFGMDASGQNMTGVCTYELTNIAQDGHSATFTGSGFSLRQEATYFAVSPYKEDNVDKRDITVDYTGQRQIMNLVGNDLTEEQNQVLGQLLGQYDYNVAFTTASGVDHARFDFNHVGAILRLQLTMPEAAHCTKLTLSDSKHLLYQPVRHMDLTSSEDQDADYAPVFLPLEAYDGNNELFTLDLGPDADGSIEVEANGTLTCYMTLPAQDLSGSSLFVRIDTQEGVPYFASVVGKNMRAGKAYSYTTTVQKAGFLAVNLIVEPHWMYGNTVPQTRGAGDPGYDHALTCPTHLSLLLVDNGGDNQLKEYTALTDADWILNSSGQWERQEIFELAPSASRSEARVYCIASQQAIPGLSTTASESTIQTLTMNLASGQEAELRNVYTTPWNGNDGFEGTVENINSAPSVVAHLYHVASKVDVQWNSTSALTGYVGLNGVQTQDILLFQPTKNTGSGTYAPQVAIDGGNCYNGRAVFYVAQPASRTYSVTTGSKTQDITFTPHEQYTSWMRGQITIE